ncbi:SEC-C domain-containing protein [Paenibacillus sp. S150]|nr:SEC-C domain-containing protein [Paenibacillus sp. S150]
MEQVQRVCDYYGWNYIMGMEFIEDLNDLNKALLEQLTPENIYDPCPCGSGKKFKFCCAGKMKNFDLDAYLTDFSAGETR